jgi:uncharacterized membrane protein YeaQ/YmgE (transglycosylase-associated protein family)
MPYYCETALNPLGTFPAEPVNTITSFVPAILGVLALIYLIRNGNRSTVAYTLAVLTLLTGLGSVAWHSMRTPTTLLIDWLPGAIYFLILVFFWAYYAAGRYVGVGLGLAIAVLVFFVPFPVIQQYRLIIIGVLAAIAIGLVVATRLKQREAFNWALGMVGSAIVAVTLRTLDLSVCDVIPVGTHFFWHIFLGFAAYAGVRLIVRLQPEPNAPADQPA